jgi:hypothetical protein
MGIWKEKFREDRIASEEADKAGKGERGRAQAVKSFVPFHYGEHGRAKNKEKLNIS